MQIRFESYPAEVRRENKYLWQALGSDQGRPRYQWAFSDDLNMPLPVMKEGGEVEYDFHCACGVNTSVHSANCNWSTPRMKWTLTNIAFGLNGVWVFVKWKAPEETREDWERIYGSYPYPEGGYYTPVGDLVRCIHIPGGDMPLHSTSEYVVQATREHLKKSAKEHTKAISDRWDRMDKEKRLEREYMFKNAAVPHEGFAGKKENWSAGGIGDSPVLVTK